MPFDRLRAHRQQTQDASADLVAHSSRRYRSYPNKCWLLRQADAIVTVTTTKTIIREHETDLVVREARAVAADVVVLTLADPRGGELPPWTPGAHVDLILGDDLTRLAGGCPSRAR